jgi:hypothetical protein
VQLLTKIDESGTHGDSPHMIMAGYTARLNQWNRFNLKWRKALRKAGLEYFHAKEHWKHPFSAKGSQDRRRQPSFWFRRQNKRNGLQAVLSK